MQLRRLALVIGFSGMLFVNLAHALGLGDITLKSSLNEPLNAEIKLLQVGSLSEGEIRVKLASADAFDRVGVDRVFFLSDMRFNVDMKRRVIRVTTRKPVSEPYLNFLVETQWPAGRLLREYTLLMDIPNVAKNRKARAISTPKASAQPTRRSTPVQRSTPKAAPVARTPVDSYRVKPGDTLWQVAERVRPSNGVTVYQTMMGLQRANPEAFLEGNINNLRKGQVLRVPDVSEIQQQTHRQAVSAAAKQYQDWKATRSTPAPLQGSDRKETVKTKTEPAGNLRIGAGGDPDGSVGAGSEGNTKALAQAKEEADRLKRENQELTEKLKSVEGQAEDAQRIIDLQNKKIAELSSDEASTEATDLETITPETTEPEITEAGIDGSESTSTETEATETETETTETETTETASTETVPADEPTDEATTELVDSTVEDPAVAEAEVAPYTRGPSNPYAREAEPESVEPVEEVVEEEAAAETPAEEAKVEETPVESSEGFVTKAMNWVKSNIALAGGALAALLLMIVLLFRRGGDKDFEELNFDEDDLDSETDIDVSGLDEDYTENTLDISSELETEFDSEDLSNYDDDSGAVESETEDVVGEAEIYAGLGQLDKARGLLVREIEVNPENTDARLALMKILTEQNDLEEFDGQYAQMLPFANGIAVDKARSLRQQFEGAADFDETMYRADNDLADSSEQGGLDDLDDLEALDSEGVDSLFNNDGEFAEKAINADDELELDLDLDLSDLDDEVGADFTDDLDIDLGSEELLDETTSNLAGELKDSTVESVDNTVSDIASFDKDLEDSLGDLSSELDQLEDTTPGDIAVDEPLSEIKADDLDDLDLDLELELDDELSSELNEDMDFSTEFDLDLDLGDDIPTTTDSLEPEAAELTDTIGDVLAVDTSAGDLEMDDLERSLMSDLDADALEDDLDLDLDLDAPPEALDMQSLDQEIDAMTSDLDISDVEVDDISLGDEADSSFDEAMQSTVPEGTSLVDDDDLSFLNEADEVATKLDLARAYIEMEDRDGAQDILNEVMEEGSPAQQSDAKKLLDSL